MKKLIMLLLGSIALLSVEAQTYESTVTIVVKGERNKEVLVDGTSYTINTDVSSTTTVNMPVTITGLSYGQHTLQVRRTNQYGNTTTGNKTTFNLRSGYDLTITVNNNGSILLKETKAKPVSGNPGAYQPPMSTANFNLLVKNISNLRNANQRVVAITNAFNNTANYFTTAQARQLIGLVSSQSSRLSLAKASYKTITDPENFTQVNNLITSQASRRELATYVKKYDQEHAPVTGTVKVPMTDARFKALYNDAQGQWPATSKMTFLSNVFENENNHFTVSQVRQLIEVVYPENDRLSLAKAAYNNVVDPANFSQLYTLLDYQSNRTDLDNYVRSFNATNPTTPMTTAAFNNLYNEAQQQWSASARATYIANVFANSNNYFTTIQARQLILLVTPEPDRLSLAKAAWDNITDPANYGQLYDLFNSTTYRNDFAIYANSHGAIVSQQAAMSDAAFTSLYNTISNQWGFGAKMSSLTNTFNNADNYFTVAQARQLIQLVSDEENRLQLGKLAYNNVVDPANYSQLYDLLASQSSRNELDAFVKANGTTDTNPTGTPMSAAAFNSLYYDAQQQYSASTRLNFIANAFANSYNYFTSAQARQLILLVTPESDRLSLAKAAWDNITDQANYGVLYDLFSTAYYRNEFSVYANAHGATAVNYRVAMSDTDFTTLYNTISNQWGFGVKMTSLTNTFNNAEYYFTVAQTRQLIQLVSDEQNRLQLGKLAFNNVVDPENYSQLYDLLASQSSRNELDAFVKANSTSVGYRTQ